MALMDANLIARLPGVMMANSDNRRKKHVTARRYALQAVVRFFIHVVKARFKPG
jgi:hypothetical protein